MSDIEYSYRIEEITETEGQGPVVVSVTYRPDDERLQEVTRNVSVPVHKARDAEHAEEIMDQKIRGRAPVTEWAEALALIDAPPAPPREDVLKHLETRVGTNRRNEEPRRPTREERIRREFLKGGGEG